MVATPLVAYSLAKIKWKGCLLYTSYRINGRDTASGETAAFFVKEIWLEAVEHPGKESGWLPERNTVCYSTCGYETGAVKRAVLAEEAETFIIEDRSGRICLKKSLEHVVWKEDCLLYTSRFTQIDPMTSP